MGDAAEDLEEVVGSFDSAVGWPAGVVPVEDLVAPGDDGVDDVVKLDELAGGVEVGEPIERLEGAVAVIGEVEAVQILQGPPGHVESRVFGEEFVEAGPVGVVEVIAALQQQEPGPEHSGIERGLHTLGLAALQVPAHCGEAFGEPGRSHGTGRARDEPRRAGCRWRS